MIDAPIYIDWLLAICFFVAAIVQFMWLSFHGSSVGRWAQAIGFTGLAIRLAWSLAQGHDPPVAAVSIPFLIFIASGASVTAVQQMRFLWLDIRCYRSPGLRCFREDRIRAALKGRKR